jgi:preprotein translocase subunit SecE
VAFLDGVKRSFGSTFSFFADSWSELRKVRWPSRKELISYTIVVLVTVVFVTLYFYVIDLGLTELIDMFFG